MVQNWCCKHCSLHLSSFNAVFFCCGDLKFYVMTSINVFPWVMSYFHFHFPKRKETLCIQFTKVSICFLSVYTSKQCEICYKPWGGDLTLTCHIKLVYLPNSFKCMVHFSCWFETPHLESLGWFGCSCCYLFFWVRDSDRLVWAQMLSVAKIGFVFHSSCLYCHTLEL